MYVFATLNVERAEFMHTESVKRRKRLLVHVKSVIAMLARDLLIDPVDKKYVLRRLHSEGFTFVTKILPSFSKYVLACCENSKILDVVEYGLTHFTVQGRSPRFMRGLLRLAVEGSADALFRIRQFCDYFYKTCLKISSDGIRQATIEYVETDTAYDFEKIDWREITRMRKILHTCFPVLCSASPASLYSVYRPHDGPGSFAGSEAVVGRTLRDYYKHSDQTCKPETIWEYKKLPMSLIGTATEKLRPFGGFFKSYPSSNETLNYVRDERVADILFVPKDARGPRTISKEPYFLLKAQMGAGSYIASLLETESNGHINFKKQEVNQDLARISSVSRESATLDLQKASDRVWLSVVRGLTRYAPALRHAVGLRSTHVRYKLDGKHHFHELKKFANMGSGLCFPILSMVVFLSAVSSLVQKYHYSIKAAVGAVNVYGDDLIVPTSCLTGVREGLVAIGLVVNDDKTYSKGYFRESCGGDYYHGIDVAPVRLRLSNAALGTASEYRNGVIPIQNASGIIQIDAHCRELQDKGMQGLATLYYRYLEGRLGSLPNIARDSNCIGIYDPSAILTGFAGKAYFPMIQKTKQSDACPIKGLGQSFKAIDGLVQDWNLTPVRRQLTLKRRVPALYELAAWGLPQRPADIIDSSDPLFYKRDLLRSGRLLGLPYHTAKNSILDSFSVFQRWITAFYYTTE